MITPSPRAHHLPIFPSNALTPLTPMTCAFRRSNICKISILPACAAWCSGAKPHEATTFCRSSVHNGWSNLGKKGKTKGRRVFYLWCFLSVFFINVSTVFKDLLNKFGFLGLKILGFCAISRIIHYFHHKANPSPPRIGSILGKSLLMEVFEF